MKRHIQICLGEALTPVGTLVYEASGNRESCKFIYHNEWLASSSSFQLSPDLPLQAGMMFHPKFRDGSAFFDCFADTEPDGWAKKVILRDYTKRRKLALEQGSGDEYPPLNSLDYLLVLQQLRFDEYRASHECVSCKESNHS